MVGRLGQGAGDDLVDGRGQVGAEGGEPGWGGFEVGYLEELAGTYHRFYDACQVLPMDEEPATPLTYARLALCEATRVVLANGLDLLGVSAPERM